MPELPEVETVRRGLNQLTLSSEITGGDVLLPRTVAYPFSADEFITGIKGNLIATWLRRGKYLIAQLSPPLSNKDLSNLSNLSKPNSQTSYLGAHLRMTGQLLWLTQDEPLHKHTRVRIFFKNNQELRFVDQRTFGQMWWVPQSVKIESVITGLAKLAADPFELEFTVQFLADKFKKIRRPIKTALLDQSVVAGLGNIYADEALFLSQIQPETLCVDLKPKQIKPLQEAIIQVLSKSIEQGGTTFSNFLNVEGVNGNYGGVAWVYNRTSEPCRICATPIKRIKLGGRSSHFCPHCQK
jgi:formamidopyrimidine-DNA glycosylase